MKFFKYKYILFNLTLTSFLLISASECYSQDPYVPDLDWWGRIHYVNYVRTWDAKVPDQNPVNLMTRPLRDVQESSVYYDGLGRVIQKVAKFGANSPEFADPMDIVEHFEYDSYGRQAIKILPSPYFAGTLSTDFGPRNNAGGFKGIDAAGTSMHYYGQTLQDPSEITPGEWGLAFNLAWAYGKTNYENSPLNRVDNSYAPGVNWIGSESAVNESSKHNVRIQYYTNTTIDNVKIWKVTNGAAPGDWGTYIVDGNYDPGYLYKKITFDEHDKQTIEFTDKEGKVILKKVQLTGADDLGGGQPYGSGWLCTYYIYDDLSRLRAVIQPEGVQRLFQNGWNVTATLLYEYFFGYEYDGRNRMIMKKVPAVKPAESIFMIYDALDRLVMTQDGKQRDAGVNSWTTTLYDIHSRPVIKGFLKNTFDNKTFAQHLAAASQSTSYPFAITSQPASGIWTVLSQSGYDNYLTVPSESGFTATLDQTFTSGIYLNTTYNTTPLYAQQPIQSDKTLDLVTWSKVLVYGTTTYLFSVNFYDDKGRVIQVKSTNITAGQDITTTQYNWVGQPLRIVQKQQIGGSTNPQTTIILTDIGYDDLGRPIQTQKKVQNTLVNNNEWTTWVTISKNEYDGLGQLKRKSLGNKKDPATGNYNVDPLTKLDYTYNIRGWLLSINKDFINSPNNDQYFAMELGYDKDPSLGSNTVKQFTGNISGMLWKSEGDQKRRRYDFNYDEVSRLKDANFGQYVSGSGNSATFDVTTDKVDFSEKILEYDMNGNIMRLQRKGLKLNESPLIDDLTYGYKYNSSNEVQLVTDAITSDANSKLGDFKDGANAAGTADYSYSVNGSLTKDLNKNINSFTYWPYVDLIKVITYTSKNIITNAWNTTNYTYSDDGVKLQKVTYEGTNVLSNGNNIPATITSTTQYIGPGVYESKSYSDGALSSLAYTRKLQFIAHEEGRIRLLYKNASTPNTPTGFAFDYFIKDHLGNVRMVLTDELQQDIYPVATLEGNAAVNTSAIYKEQEYYTINTSNVVDKLSTVPDYKNKNGGDNALDAPVNPNPNSVVTDNSAKMYKLDGGINNKMGLGITLKVMSGDKLDIYGKSYYTTETSGSGGNVLAPVVDILTGLLSGPTGSVAAGAHGGVTGPQLSGFTKTTDGVDALRAIQTTQTNGTPNAPRAFINYLFFNEQFACVGQGVSRVNGTPGLKNHYDDPSMQNIKVPANGYVYIYVSNESPVNVYFDNLQVIHTRGPIMEETHYYPFGLTMAGISSRAFDKLDNKYKYNGIELNTDMGLDIYDAHFRNLDPQTGRWWQVDPKIESMEAWSPYVSNFNNPIRYKDFLGDYPDPPIKLKQYLNGVWSGFKGFYGNLGNQAKYYYHNPEQRLIYAANAMFNPVEKAKIIFNGSILGMGIDNYKLIKTQVNNLSKGDFEKAGNVSGNKAGEAVLQGAVFFGTGAVAKAFNFGKASLNQLEPIQPELQQFSGTEKAWSSGATPNSIYTYLSTDGKAVSNYIYNNDGNVMFQVDFGKHGKYLSGHGHEMQVPGNLGSGHTSHLPFEMVPEQYKKIPQGVQYSTPPGQ